MTYYCCMCGRKTVPAMMIGNQAVGPTCARKAGLMTAKVRKPGKVREVRPVRDMATMDLFEEQEK